MNADTPRAADPDAPLVTAEQLDAWQAAFDAVKKAMPDPYWFVPGYVNGLDHGDPNDASDSYDLLEDPPADLLRFWVVSDAAMPLLIAEVRRLRAEVVELEVQGWGDDGQYAEKYLGKQP